MTDGFLADDLGERLRPPAAVQRAVRRRRRHRPGRRCWAASRSGSKAVHRLQLPCTLRRSERPRALHHKRLGPGRTAAPGEDRLVLLPSGPDTVHESPLRGTRPSTSLVTAAFENGDLGREFSPAGADCRYRAPLVPRLARPPNHSRGRPAGSAGPARTCLGRSEAWRRGGDSNPRRVAPNRISNAAP